MLVIYFPLITEWICLEVGFKSDGRTHAFKHCQVLCCNKPKEWWGFEIALLEWNKCTDFKDTREVESVVFLQFWGGEEDDIQIFWSSQFTE